MTYPPGTKLYQWSQLHDSSTRWHRTGKVGIVELYEPRPGDKRIGFYRAIPGMPVVRQIRQRDGEPTPFIEVLSDVATWLPDGQEMQR